MNATFFFKECKRTQCSFAKNIKEHKERNVLMPKNAKERRTLRSFEKKACTTLVLFLKYIFIDIYRYLYRYTDI